MFVDHGHGLCTSYNHLARPLGLSGYSGIDAFVGFPWTPPHVHFNVWLDGRYVDPFAHDGEASLWRHADGPRPTPQGERAEEAVDSPWDDDAIARLAEHAAHPGARAEIEQAPTLHERRGAALFQLAYFPTRFDRERLGPSFSLFRAAHSREPRLDLPFSARDYDGVAFPDR